MLNKKTSGLVIVDTEASAATQRNYISTGINYRAIQSKLVYGQI